MGFVGAAHLVYIVVDNRLQPVQWRGLMNLDNEIISNADIERLTDYKIPSKQCERLRAAGVFFIEGRDGRPRTTWGHFNNPLAQRIQQKSADNSLQPNFGALD